MDFCNIFQKYEFLRNTYFYRFRKILRKAIWYFSKNCPYICLISCENLKFIAILTKELLCFKVEYLSVGFNQILRISGRRTQYDFGWHDSPTLNVKQNNACKICTLVYFRSKVSESCVWSLYSLRWSEQRLSPRYASDVVLNNVILVHIGGDILKCLTW